MKNQKPRARRSPLKAMSEEELQAEVKKYALMFGWSYYHTRDSRGSDEGFPDTVMLRKRRQVIAELKKEGEKPTPGQMEWMQRFGECGAECYVWRPTDLQEIVKVLR
jgi:hypothetical protein